MPLLVRVLLVRVLLAACFSRNAAQYGIPVRPLGPLGLRYVIALLLSVISSRIVGHVSISRFGFEFLVAIRSA